jgi:hypothetical protein
VPAPRGRLGLPGHLPVLAHIREREMPLHQPSRVLAEVGLAGLGQALHALSEPDRVPDRGVLHVEVVPDRTDHDLA